MDRKISILNENFTIVTKNFEFIEQEKEIYFPLVRKKIDEILTRRSTISCHISKIIFQALEDVFKMETIYSNTNNKIPENDKLYISLREYIKNSNTFKKKTQKNQKAVGFFYGEFAIRTKELEYEIQNKEIYLPLVINRIDELIENTTKSIQISKLVFQALKDVFETSKIFTPPESSYIVPNNDDLYNFLSKYVRNNNKIKELMEKNKNELELTKINREKYLKKNYECDSYLQKQRESYVAWLRKQGARIYY